MDMILKNTFQSISPAYELIGDVTVEGTAKTQVDFTGLNIGKDDELLLVSTIIKPITTATSFSIYINGNVTNTNYYQQYMGVSSTSISAGRINSSGMTFIGSVAATNFVLSKIKVTNSGYVVWMDEENRTIGGSSLNANSNCVASTFTVSTITTLSVKASVTNAIGTGSRFQLYKLVAEKVADIIVPSNTTSVDITGLDIGKDGEYYLVSDVVNATGAERTYSLSVNDTSVQTNYWTQQLYAQGTTVGGFRFNQMLLGACLTGKMSLFNSNIKLTNSGYIIVQSSDTYSYGGASIGLEKYATTTTFTASSITKFTITASVTDAIGANSRFTLYKMK